MTAPPETALVRELRAHIHELKHLEHRSTRQVADLERHNKELRVAVAALLAPGPPPSQASQKTGLTPLVTKNPCVFNG